MTGGALPRIGIDVHHLAALEGNRSYATSLLRALARSGSGERFTLRAYGPASSQDPAALAGLEAGERGAIEFGPGLPTGAWRRTALAVPLTQRRDRLDVWHASFVAPPFARARVVLAVHDVLALTRPDLFSRPFALRMKLLLPRSIARARRVLVPTEHVKAELERLGLARGKVAVAPIGLDERVFRPEPAPDNAPVRARLGAGERYVLAVGRADRRKRLDLLERAFSRVARAGEQLVLAGPLGARAPGAGTVVVRSPSERELAALYRGARVLAFPSAGEGLGLPVLEALACGCPVVASDLPAVREAAGAGVLAFLQESAIEDGLGRALRLGLDLGDSDRSALGAKGVALARRFSLESMARATEAAWREALES